MSANQIGYHLISKEKTRERMITYILGLEAFRS